MNKREIVTGLFVFFCLGNVFQILIRDYGTKLVESEQASEPIEFKNFNLTKVEPEESKAEAERSTTETATDPREEPAIAETPPRPPKRKITFGPWDDSWKQFVKPLGAPVYKYTPMGMFHTRQFGVTTMYVFEDNSKLFVNSDGNVTYEYPD